MFIPPYITERKWETCQENKKEDMLFSQTSPYKDNIECLDDLFTKGKAHVKRLYVTAKAGVGKTSFCQFIIMLWCALKENNTRFIEKLKSIGCGAYLISIEKLKDFDFLFHVPLKRVRKNVCVDQMIYNQIFRHLNHALDITFINQVMASKKCLVILDGFDEWDHPQDSQDCVRDPCFLPHWRDNPNCTIMITSRPWKISDSMIHIAKNDICVKIHNFDRASSRTLVQDVNKELNKHHVQTPVDSSGLFERIDSCNLWDLLSLPLVAIQIICLLHDGRSIVESRCHAYMGMLNLLLINAEKKCTPHDIPLAELTEENIVSGIGCMSKNKYCTKYSSLLVKLGKLAFKTLLSENEQILEETVLQYLKPEESKFALHSGILSEDQGEKRASYRENTYSFLHATYQEFLACLYLVSLCVAKNNSELKKRVRRTWKNVPK